MKRAKLYSNQHRSVWVRFLDLLSNDYNSLGCLDENLCVRLEKEIPDVTFWPTNSPLLLGAGEVDAGQRQLLSDPQCHPARSLLQNQPAL